MIIKKSDVPTPYAIRCSGNVDLDGKPCQGGEPIYLTQESYDSQLMSNHPGWMCPCCGGLAWFDDDNYSDFLPGLRKG